MLLDDAPRLTASLVVALDVLPDVDDAALSNRLVIGVRLPSCLDVKI